MSSTKPLTILFDANSLMVQRTGVGYYTAGLIASIAAADPNIRLVGYYYNFLGRKQPPASPQAPNISYLPIYTFPGPLVNLLRRFQVEVPIEILLGKSADFILYPNFLGQPSLYKTPNAPIIHDLMYHDHPQYGSDKSVRDLTRFVPGTLKRSSFIIAVSDFTKKRIVDVYDIPPENILKTFIPPVEVAIIPKAKAKKIVARQGINKPYLLFVGTMEPRKNIVNLLEAYRQLPARLRDSYSLVLAGKIDWKYQETQQKLETMQADGYDIHYLGYVDNDTRAALYQCARLFVMSPHYEGFGMQTLEAMQYGIPCAISDITVLRETGGNLVSYFDHTDPADMAQVIGACLIGKKPDPKALQQYVAQQPHWDQVGKLVADRIRKTLGKEGKL